MIYDADGGAVALEEIFKAVMLSSDLSDIIERADEFESMSAQDVLAWASSRWREQLAVSVSFGGFSGMVIIDILARIDAPATVYYLDTDLLFPETYETIEAVRRRYGLSPVRVDAGLTLEEQERRHGARLWASDPDACCNLRKVVPQKRFLRDYGAWVSGIRRDQSGARSNVSVVSWDPVFEVLKINPLATWTAPMVLAYVEAYDVPYNPLIDRGYRSIGCTHCTMPTFDNSRAGRWRDFAKTECGLHARETGLPTQEGSQ